MTDSGAQDPEQSKEVPGASGKTVTDAVGASVGAAIGLWVAGPVGTIAGAAARPLVARLSELALRRANTFWQSLRAGIAAQGMTEEEWTDKVAADPAAENAVLEILAAAGRTLDVQQLAALGQIAARVPELDADEMAAATYFARILNSLSRVHITTLRLLDHLWDDRTDSLGVQPDELLAVMGAERPLARSIMRTLELHGLAVDNARLYPDKLGVFWEITDLGRRFLAFSQSL